jgi:hypothetical protein
MSDGPQKPRVVDNPDVGELYANKTIGASFDGGGITVLLGCSRVIPELVDTPLERNEPPAVPCTHPHGLSVFLTFEKSVLSVPSVLSAEFTTA